MARWAAGRLNQGSRTCGGGPPRPRPSSWAPAELVPPPRWGPWPRARKARRGRLRGGAEIVDGDPASLEDRGEGVVLFGGPLGPGNVVVQGLCGVAGCESGQRARPRNGEGSAGR